MVGAAIGSRTAPKGCAVLAQPYVLQKQWWGAAMGSRTAPKGGSAPEPPLPILLYYAPAIRSEKVFSVERMICYFRSGLTNQTFATVMIHIHTVTYVSSPSTLHRKNRAEFQCRVLHFNNIHPNYMGM